MDRAVLAGINWKGASVLPVMLVLLMISVVLTGTTSVFFMLSLFLSWVLGVPLMILSLGNSVLTTEDQSYLLLKRFGPFTYSRVKLPKIEEVLIRSVVRRSQSSRRVVSETLLDDGFGRREVVTSGSDARCWRAAFRAWQFTGAPIRDRTLVGGRVYQGRISEVLSVQRERTVDVPRRLNPVEKFQVFSLLVGMVVIFAVNLGGYDPVTVVVISVLEGVLLLALLATSFKLLARRVVLVDSSGLEIVSEVLGIRRSRRILIEELWDVVIKRPERKETSGSFRLGVSETEVAVRAGGDEYSIGRFTREEAESVWEQITGRSVDDAEQ